MKNWPWCLLNQYNLCQYWLLDRNDKMSTGTEVPNLVIVRSIMLYIHSGKISCTFAFKWNLISTINFFIKSEMLVLLRLMGLLTITAYSLIHFYLLNICCRGFRWSHQTTKLSAPWKVDTTNVVSIKHFMLQLFHKLAI
jgi:hypothetical protein